MFYFGPSCYPPPQPTLGFHFSEKHKTMSCKVHQRIISNLNTCIPNSSNISGTDICPIISSDLILYVLNLFYIMLTMFNVSEGI